MEEEGRRRWIGRQERKCTYWPASACSYWSAAVTVECLPVSTGGTSETCPKMHFSLRLARLLLVSAVFCVGKRSISPASRSVRRCPCNEATFRAFQWALNWALIVFESFLRSLFRRWGEVGARPVPRVQQTHQARAEYDGEGAREFRSCLRATDQRGERIFHTYTLKRCCEWSDRVRLNMQLPHNK